MFAPVANATYLSIMYRKDESCCQLCDHLVPTPKQFACDTCQQQTP